MADDDKRIILRNEKGHFVKGTPGPNPKPTGRPKSYKGIAKDIQKRTGNGKELLDFIESVLKGTVEGGSTLAAKMWACEQLLNRGYGRAPQVVEVHSDATDTPAVALDFSQLSDEELEAMEKAAEIVNNLADKQKGVIDV